MAKARIGAVLKIGIVAASLVWVTGVTARADDGVVEALERISYPAVGVQFHSEIMVSEKDAAAYESIYRTEMIRLFEKMENLVRKERAKKK